MPATVGDATAVRNGFHSLVMDVTMALDTLALDTLSLDTLALDTLALDTLALDTMALDTMALDTLALDTMALDTMALDTLALDTLALDTLALDTLALDTLSLPVLEPLIPGRLLDVTVRALSCLYAGGSVATCMAVLQVGSGLQLHTASTGSKEEDYEKDAATIVQKCHYQNFQLLGVC
ncbi:E3 ubiquitin-protein ligase UBR4 isoform X2 [Salmo trutta]|uniref:E3 ubiquitin-protein ligase UBR4 isoform X2 n=1 Tax=Salmo trutta TaxID=8032 RepID=UPI0011329F15|nr:E3 ubiquitin-protein ligase UBR4-like isoform X2 [Salmo trutta]